MVHRTPGGRRQANVWRRVRASPRVAPFHDPELADTSNGEATMGIRPLKLAPNPFLLRHAEERARSFQNRIADTITSFAGSMSFVYLHVAAFAVWMAWFEAMPWPTLTLAVSLEAIFLSTFVMISQNRADEKRQVLAAQEWESVQLEEKQNEELLQLSRQILQLTDAIHRLTVARPGKTTAPRDPS